MLIISFAKRAVKQNKSKKRSCCLACALAER